MSSKLISVVNNWMPTFQTPKMTQKVSFHLSYLQLIVILVHSQLIQLTHTDYFLNYARSFTNFFSFNSVWAQNYANWIYSTALLSSWLYIVLLLSIIIFTIIQSLRYPHKLRVLPPYLAELLQLHSTVIFWVIAMVLIAPWDLEAEDIYEDTKIINNNRVIKVANEVFLVLTYAIGGIASLFCVDYFKDNRNKFAVRTCFDQMTIFLKKAILVFTNFAFVKESYTARLMIALALLTLALVRHYFLYSRAPYHFYNTLKEALIWNFCGIWILIASVISLLIQYEKDTRQHGFTIFYLECLLLPLGIKCTITSFERMLQKYLSSQNKDLKTESDVFKKILALQKVTKMPEKSGKINQGVYTNCDSYNLIEESMQKLRINSDLRLALITEILNNSKPTQALICLEHFIPKNSGILLKIKRAALLQIIQSKLQEEANQRQKSDFDIQQFIDFQFDKRFCTDMLLANVRRYIDFWSYYNQPSFRLSKLLDKSIAIEQAADKIESAFKQYTSKHPEFGQVLGEDYCLYMALIRNKPIEANEFRQKYLLTQKHRAIQDTSFSSAIALYISMSNKERGKILYASTERLSALGYSQADINNKNLSILLPPVMGEKHIQAINQKFQHFEALKDSQTHCKEVLVQDKEGFLLPFIIDMTVIPHVYESLTYACVLRPKRAEYEYIMFLVNGGVIGVSRRISQILNLSSFETVRIQDICAEFANKSFTQSPGKGKKQKTLINIATILEQFRSQWNLLTFYNEKEDTLSKEDTDNFCLEAKLEEENILDEKFYILKIKNDVYSEAVIEEPMETIPNEATNHNIRLIDNTHEVLSENNERLLSIESPKHEKATLLNHTEESHMVLKPRLLSNRATEEIQVTATIRSSRKVDIVKNIEREDEPVQLNLSTTANKSSSGFEDMSTPAALKAYIEYKLRALPTNKLLKIINIAVGAVLALAIAFLFSFRQIEQTTLEIVAKNTDILNITTNRMFQIVQLNRNMEYNYLMNNGLIKDNRYNETYKVASFRPLILATNRREQMTNTFNSLMREKANSIDSDLQRQIYDYTVPLTDENGAVMYKNIFDAAVELTLKAKKVFSDNVGKFNATNENINFVLRNALNELIAGSEFASDIILKDIDKRLDYLVRLESYFLLVMFSLVIVLLCLLGCQQISLVKDRNRLISRLLFLDRRGFADALGKSERFEKILSDKYGLKNEKSISAPQTKTLPVNYNLFSKKNANKTGLNTQYILMFCLGIVLAFVILAPFLFILLSMTSMSAFLKNKNISIVEVNTHLYEIFMLQTTLCDYIDPNGIHRLRTKPLEEEWERTFKRRTKMTSFLFDLLLTLEKENKCNSNIIQSIQTLMTGDLCTIFPNSGAVTPTLSYPCRTIGGGASMRGIQGAVDYILAGLRTLKTNYDHSNKTKEGSQQILDSPEALQVENIVTYWHQEALKGVYALLTQCNVEESDEFNESLEIQLIAYLVLYAIGTMVVSYFWNKILVREVDGWRKIIRQVPLEVIVRNKPLITYLKYL